MNIGYNFGSHTMMEFAVQAAEPGRAPGPGTSGVVQTNSLQFQEEWVIVRTAMMRVVREFHGAKERFMQVFAELQPMMLAPDWLEYE